MLGKKIKRQPFSNTPKQWGQNGPKTGPKLENISLKTVIFPCRNGSQIRSNINEAPRNLTKTTTQLLYTNKKKIYIYIYILKNKLDKGKYGEDPRKLMK